MNNRFLLTVALLLLATSAFALSPEHTEWGNGPARFLMTKEEAAQWKSLQTDEEAAAFVALFWARRDPTAETPRNEFREQFDAAVDYANKNLGFKKTPGWMTDRGKTLILYGQPKKLERSAPPAPTVDAQEERSQWVQWIYEGDEAKALFNVQRAAIRFTDRLGSGDFKMERGAVDVAGAEKRAISRAIVQPDLKVAPTFAAAAPAAAPAPAAPSVQTELATASLASAVSDLKAGKALAGGKPVFATWGEYVTAAGTYFVPVMLYVPKSSGLDGSKSLTFFGSIQDEAGKGVLAFEEPVTLKSSRDDFYIDKTLSLGGGKQRGFFGLADNGTPVAIVAVDMTLAGSLDKDAPAVSPLLLSNNIYPLPEAQEATDPFAFGGVKVIPKGDKTFRPTDELWYFFELRNPGMPEAPVPADGAAPAEAPAPAPKVQLKIDVEGTDTTGKKVKMSAPPREVDAVEMKGVPGHFGMGSAIPLTTFKAGDYSFTIKVIDTVRKASYTISEKFKVIE